MKKIIDYFREVKKETKKSHWPTGKELFKYSVITVTMIIFFGVFFYVLDLLFALLKGVFS